MFTKGYKQSSAHKAKAKAARELKFGKAKCATCGDEFSKYIRTSKYCNKPACTNGRTSQIYRERSITNPLRTAKRLQSVDYESGRRQMLCDGSCFADPYISDQFPCEDGEILCLVFCRHEGCYILKTFALVDEAEQISLNVRGLFAEFKKRRRRERPLNFPHE